MPEAQYTVSGFNIAGLDPIEVAKPVTGTTLTLTDSDIGKMNVFSGSATTTVALPSASGTLDGYDKAGRMIGLRGASTMTAKINLSGLTPAISLLKNHRLILVSNGTSWEIHHHYWPPMTGYFSAYRSTDVAITANSNTLLVYNTTSDASGNADGWYNFTTGVYSPVLPGYYEFNLFASVTATGGVHLLYLTRSGTQYNLDRRNYSGLVVETLSGSSILYADGSTHSFQPQLFSTVASTHSGNGSVFFQAKYKGPI